MSAAIRYPSDVDVCSHCGKESIDYGWLITHDCFDPDNYVEYGCACLGGPHCCIRRDERERRFLLQRVANMLRAISNPDRR